MGSCLRPEPQGNEIEISKPFCPFLPSFLPFAAPFLLILLLVTEKDSQEIIVFFPYVKERNEKDE